MSPEEATTTTTSSTTTSSTTSTSSQPPALKKYLPPLTLKGFQVWSLRPRMSSKPVPSTPLYTLKPPITSTPQLPVTSVFTVPMYLDRMIGLGVQFTKVIDLTAFNINHNRQLDHNANETTAHETAALFNTPNPPNTVIKSFNDAEEWDDYSVEKVVLVPSSPSDLYPPPSLLHPPLTSPGNLALYCYDSSITRYATIYYLCKILRWPFQVAYSHVGGHWDPKAVSLLINHFHYSGPTEIHTTPPPPWITSPYPKTLLKNYVSDGFALPLPVVKKRRLESPKVTQSPWVKLDISSKIHSRVTSVIKSMLLKPSPSLVSLTPSEVMSNIKKENVAVTWIPEGPLTKILYLRDGVFGLQDDQINHIPKVTLNNGRGEKTHRTLLCGYVTHEVERGRRFLAFDLEVEEGRGVKGRPFERRERLKNVVKNRVPREGEGVITSVKNIFKPDKLGWMLNEFKPEGGCRGVEVKDMVDGGGGVCWDLEGLKTLINKKENAEGQKP
ncbi:hypothetical protein TrVE_jg10436 [Triparma verrucosa]|uniref:Uncharacterized protein n=1 Tax=Triparma verrucosa TaxID=1606542 RepID=A0A9W7CBX7_9STRA|nr:hypothetical protein TrVE_jg10436 [Triparma verrucosa]